MSSRRFSFTLGQLIVGFVVISVVVALLAADFRSKVIREQFHTPVAVRSWDADALLLSDGRRVRLPDLSQLPAPDLPVLREATRHGVEIGSDGRVWGLIKIWHWCGNDPVRDHLSRVDISRLLIYAGEGLPSHPLSADTQGSICKDELRLGEHGWDVEEYHSYLAWIRCMEAGSITLFEEPGRRNP